MKSFLAILAGLSLTAVVMGQGNQVPRLNIFPTNVPDTISRTAVYSSMFYPLDEGSGTRVKDRSGMTQPYNLTMVNAPTWTNMAPPIANRPSFSMYFSGDASGNIGNYLTAKTLPWMKYGPTPVTGRLPPFTFTAWIYIDDTNTVDSGVGGFNDVFCLSDGNNNGFAVRVGENFTDDGYTNYNGMWNSMLQMQNTSIGGGIGVGGLDTNNQIATFTWNFVAMSWDGLFTYSVAINSNAFTASLDPAYLSGFTNTYSIPSAQTSTVFQIGKSLTGSGFYGAIANVTIYPGVYMGSNALHKLSVNETSTHKIGATH